MQHPPPTGQHEAAPQHISDWPLNDRSSVEFLLHEGDILLSLQGIVWATTPGCVSDILLPPLRHYRVPERQRMRLSGLAAARVRIVSQRPARPRMSPWRSSPSEQVRHLVSNLLRALRRKASHAAI